MLPPDWLPSGLVARPEQILPRGSFSPAWTLAVQKARDTASESSCRHKHARTQRSCKASSFSCRAETSLSGINSVGGLRSRTCCATRLTRADLPVTNAELTKARPGSETRRTSLNGAISSFRFLLLCLLVILESEERQQQNFRILRVINFLAFFGKHFCKTFCYICFWCILILIRMDLHVVY